MPIVNCKIKLIFPAVIFFSLLFFSNFASATGLEKQGRWLTYDNQHVYYVGVDAQQLAADPSLNYVAILDQFQTYGINKVRIWLDAYWSPTPYLHPWVYNTTTGKYDLDTWNASYWSGLKAFVAAARDRNIIVEISLFAAYPSDPDWWTNNDMRMAWNKAYNSNGVFSANASGHFFPEFFNLNSAEKSYSGKTLKQYQQALVDKALLELDSYPNVYYEVMNEFFETASRFTNGYATVAPWQQFWADYLRSKTTHVITTHTHDAFNPAMGTTGVEYFWDRASVDVLNYHLYNADPTSISNLLHTSQAKGKILQCNESFEWYNSQKITDLNLVNQVTKEAWAWFVSGGYYAFYNAQHTEYAGWDQLGVRAKTLHDLVDKVRFWEMSPVDDSGNEYDSLISAGPAGANHQVLANPGSQYVAFFWGTPNSTNVSMQLPTGNYDYEWYDVRNGNLLRRGTVAGGGNASIGSPGSSSWDGSAGAALFVLAQGSAGCGNSTVDIGETCSSCPADAGNCLPDQMEYTMDTSGISGSTLVDAFGHYNGTISGAVADPFGHLGQALAFDGVNDQVALPSLSFLNQSFTASMWIKPDGTNPSLEQIIFGAHSDQATRKSLHLRLNGNGSLTLGFFDDDLTTPANLVKFNLWNHAVFVYDAHADISKIFINGTQAIAGSNGPIEGAAPDCYIGRWMDGYEQHYKGSIDDFRLYNTALSQADIASLYSFGSPSAPSGLAVR